MQQQAHLRGGQHASSQGEATLHILQIQGAQLHSCFQAFLSQAQDSRLLGLPSAPHLWRHSLRRVRFELDTEPAAAGTLTVTTGCSRGHVAQTGHRAQSPSTAAAADSTAGRQHQPWEQASSTCWVIVSLGSSALGGRVRISSCTSWPPTFLTFCRTAEGERLLPL